MSGRQISSGFNHVETWVFDLDNTLYSGACNLFPQIDRRMGEFIAEKLGIPIEEARRFECQNLASNDCEADTLSSGETMKASVAVSSLSLPPAPTRSRRRALGGSPKPASAERLAG